MKEITYITVSYTNANIDGAKKLEGQKPWYLTGRGEIKWRRAHPVEQKSPAKRQVAAESLKLALTNRD